MTFIKMNFKNKTVFVDADEAGKPILVGGKATMKYRLEDDRVYNPWPGNITPLDHPGSPAGRQNGAGVSTQKNTVPKTTVKKKTNGASPVPTAPKNAIIAYTDGGCIGNPGPAGLGYVISFPDGRRIKKGEPLGQGTNNIAELTAILRVLEIVTEKSAPVFIHTDSTYSIGVLTKNWKAKANVELIGEIKRKLAEFSAVTLVKVKAHVGIPDNELADDLARMSAEQQKVLA